MKTSLRRILTTAWAILCLVFLALVASVGVSLYRQANPPVHTYTIAANVPLTEPVAISYARQALIDDGKGSSTVAPVPYWRESQFSDADEERLFARNTINSNSGYVVWSNGYAVRIEREGERVECRVFAPK